MSDEPYYAANIYGEPEVSKRRKESYDANSRTLPTAVITGMVLASPYDDDSFIERHGDIDQFSPRKREEEIIDENEVWTKGEVQENHFKDLIYGILFWFHLVIMICMGIKFIPSMLEDINMVALEDNMANEKNRLLESLENNRYGYNYDDDEIGEKSLDTSTGIHIKDVLMMILLTGTIGIVFGGLALPFMITSAKPLIKFALLWNVFLSLLVMTAGIVAYIPLLALVGMLLLTICSCYAYNIWSRIPFAASNLITAVTAVRQNLGLTIHAYIAMLVLFGWTVSWIVISASMIYAQADCMGLNCESDMSILLIFLLSLSYYWTYQVVKNVLHVTVAGTVGTWWFTPNEANSCFSSGVQMSWIRAMTHSFGSICLGSLFVSIMESIRQSMKSIRELGGEENTLCCCMDCLISQLEGFVKHFNQWAFVFIALYGYSFTDAGRNVLRLFQTRGWTDIITDNLLETILFMICISVGLITGLSAIMIGYINVLNISNVLLFFIGSSIGFILTSVLMGVIGSAANAIIVCYAEAPKEFQTNHPELSIQMRSAWRIAWPLNFHY